jgi:arylsulfatase A-like enzyme
MALGLFRRRPAGPQPNIVFILLDQFRNDARPVHPVFAELGRRGCLFSETITYAPYTLASMHATMTGLYGRESGVDAYTKSDNFDAANVHTLPQYLKGAGYHTRGYTFSKILVPHSGWDSLSIVPEDEETGILESHRKELREAFGQSRPFFSYLHYGEIHHAVVKNVLRKFTPWEKEYFDNRERNYQQYLEYAYAAGEHTAQVLQTIDELDPERKTVVIVQADHGGGTGERPGEKAYGVFAYDYSIKIWMYLVAPGLVPAGREFDVQIRTVDVMPTVLDLLKIPVSKKHKAPSGRSLLPIIRGEETEDRLAFTETGGVEGPNPSPDAANVKALRDGRWKLIYNTSTHAFELYDLANDPDERDNLYTKAPDKARELWMKMAEYL